MHAPMDSFEVGQYVIQVEAVELPAQRSPFDIFGGIGTATKSYDRSYMDKPYVIRGVELPFIIVEPVRADYGPPRRSVLDTRRHKLRALSPEFVAAYLGGAQ